MSESKEFVPALYANRFLVTVNPNITRITFVEQISQEDNPHTAIVMVTSDALALANLIKELSDENRKQHPELYRTVGSSQ